MNTQQALQQAFQFLDCGNLPMAGQLFNGVLLQEPQNFAALNGRGFIALQQGRLPQSAVDFQQSLAVNPKQPFALKMLGIVQGAMGQFDASMQAFEAALALDAKDPEVYFNRANFRFQAGQAQEALLDLDAAIKLRGSYLEARSNRANLLIQLGDFARAEKDLDYLVTKVTNNPDIWVALGLAKHKVGKHREAMQCNERALKLVPNHPDALLNSSSASYDQGEYPDALVWADKAIAATFNLAEAHYARAQALMAMSRFEEAVASYSKAIDLNPNYAEAWMGRGLARVSLRNIKDALGDYQMVLKSRPEDPKLLNNIGLAFVEDLKLDQACSAYQKALTKAPSVAHIHNNLGIAFAMQREHALAIESYEKAIELDPSGLGGSWNRALALLAMGDYKRGWEGYEIRNSRKSGPRTFDKPVWLGDSDIKTKTILLHAEQGLGDTLQFCRYVNHVAERCHQVLLMVPKPLVSICSTLESKPLVFSDEDVLPAFDVHCPLMSLPLAMKTVVDTIPGNTPYLFADPEKVAMWRARLAVIDPLKVGIVWGGGFHPERPGIWGVNARRDIPLKSLESLVIKGVEWIGLQKGVGVGELGHDNFLDDWRGPKIFNMGSELYDFSDTAAVIANLDLVISVDTAVAHLAGAMAKPVWILNRFDSCWRWFVNRSDSPWYPTAVVYNQPALGDWHSVIMKVRDDLELLVREQGKQPHGIDKIAE